MARSGPLRCGGVRTGRRGRAGGGDTAGPVISGTSAAVSVVPSPPAVAPPSTAAPSRATPAAERVVSARVAYAWHWPNDQGQAERLATAMYFQPIEVPAVRERLRRAVDRIYDPQLVLRFGYVPTTCYTNRRPIADVIEA